MRPGFHSADGARRAVTVVNFQADMVTREIGLDTLEPFSCLAAQHAFRGPITGQGLASEIVSSRIANVLYDAGVNIAKVDKPGWQHVAGVRGGCEGEKKKESVSEAANQALVTAEPDTASQDIQSHLRPSFVLCFIMDFRV